MSLKDLKLNKQLNTAMEDAGFTKPTEMQTKCMGRILGGQDVLAIGPDGCGKTVTIVLSTIMQLKHEFEDVPRALVLVPNIEKVEETVAEFEKFTTYTDLRVQGVHAGANIQTQKDDLYLGVDIVVGTPDRVYALTVKYGLNLNRLKMYILDDAEELVKQGFQVPVRELAEGLPKCQHLVFSTVYHKRMENVVEPYFNYPSKVEVLPKVEEKEYDIIDQQLFRFDNYQSKLNYLTFLLNEEVNQKIVIFANTRLTAGNIYNQVEKHFKSEVSMHKALFHNQININQIEDFTEDPDLRVLIVANESDAFIDTADTPNILHFDLPNDPEVVLNRVNKDTNEGKNALIFTTDLELPLIAKIEKLVGFKFDMEDAAKEHQAAITPKKKVKIEDDGLGKAFHEKSAKNSPQVNWNSTDKIKMFGKVKKKGRDR